MSERFDGTGEFETGLVFANVRLLSLCPEEPDKTPTFVHLVMGSELDRIMGFGSYKTGLDGEIYIILVKARIS
jgi:hypothetical protein